MGKLPSPGACPALSEPLFRAIVGGLFFEARVPNGSIIDAGAHMGFESCYYAGMSPLRTVHAVEPLSSNVAFMKRQYSRSHPNLTPLLGGLGSSTSTLELGRDARRVAGVQLSLTRSSYKALGRSPVDGGGKQWSRTVTVRRVDDLFTQLWAGERLGFMHLDVQGGELDVLRGAMATLTRDQPLFSVELDVQQNHTYSKELLSIIHDAGYRAVLIEEVCGVNLDCRNILALPRSRSALFADSPTLNLAYAAGRLVPVDEGSVLQHAYPCCEPGRACCRSARSCCTASAVDNWLRLRNLPPRRDVGPWKGYLRNDVAHRTDVSVNAVGGVSSERRLAQAAKSPALEVLVYDSRRDRKGVYASVRSQGLALRVGKLKGSGARAYRSSDKPTWLLQTLPTITSNVVMMVDASDMHLLCGVDELLAKRRVLTGGDDNTVVVGGEPILWPDQQKFDGQSLSQYPEPYPVPVPRQSPLRWINCGLLLGTPSAVLRLLTCMRDRYPGFPNACPADVTRSGNYPSNYSDATKYQYSRNIVFTKGGWGWDQACYHTYFLEQVLGLLPQPHCPRLVVDYRADIVLSIGGMARQINWKSKPKRLGFNTTGAMPCVLHGNGVRGKPLYQKVQRWWGRQTPQSEYGGRQRTA